MNTAVKVQEKIDLVLLSTKKIVENLTDAKSTGRFCYYNLEDGSIGVCSVNSHHTKRHLSFGNCKTEKDVKNEIDEQIRYAAQYEDISYIK